MQITQKSVQCYMSQSYIYNRLLVSFNQHGYSNYRNTRRLWFLWQPTSEDLCQKGITLMLCRYSCLITVEFCPCLCMRLTMDLIAQKMIIAIYLHVFVLQSNALKRNIYYTYHVYLYQDSVWLDLVHSSRTEKTFIATM